MSREILISQLCGSSYQLMSKLRWCKIDFSISAFFPSVQNYPGAPHFLPDLSFKYFLTHSKGRNCLLGLTSISLSFIQLQNLFLPTRPVSILLSSLTLYLYLTLSSNKQIYLLDKSCSDRRQKVALIETRIFGRIVFIFVSSP